MQATATVALHSLMSSTLPFQKEGESSSYEDQCMQMQTVGMGSLHGQWCLGPIPKLTPFTYQNRMWEVKVTTHAFIGWGLFALEITKVRDELLPFVGQWFSHRVQKNV